MIQPTYSPFLLPGATITVKDYIGTLQEHYMRAILIVSILSLVYVCYNLFARKPRPEIVPIKEQFSRMEDALARKDWKYLITGGDSWDRVFDEIMLLPIVFLVIVAVSYYTGYEGF